MTTQQSDASRRALAEKQANTPLAGERLISRAELRQFVTASDMALWRWLREGKFPAPVYIGPRRFWLRSSIEQWLAERTAGQ